MFLVLYLGFRVDAIYFDCILVLYYGSPLAIFAVIIVFLITLKKHEKNNIFRGFSDISKNRPRHKRIPNVRKSGGKVVQLALSGPNLDSS